MHVRTEDSKAWTNKPASCYSTPFASKTYEQLLLCAKMYPPIEDDETLRLIRLAKGGDQGALDALIKHNSRKILMFAVEAHTGRRGAGGRYAARWAAHRSGVLSLDECISAALEAFWYAVKTYDENRWSDVVQKRVRFSSWVNFIARQRVGAAITKEVTRRKRLADADIVPTKLLDESADNEMPHKPVKRYTESASVTVARERLWELLDECGGPGTAELFEEWHSAPPKERAKIKEQYHAALAALRERADPEELERLRDALLNDASV